MFIKTICSVFHPDVAVAGLALGAGLGERLAQRGVEDGTHVGAVLDPAQDGLALPVTHADGDLEAAAFAGQAQLILQFAVERLQKRIDLVGADAGAVRLVLRQPLGSDCVFLNNFFHFQPLFFLSIKWFS